MSRREKWRADDRRRRNDPDKRAQYQFYASREWKALRARVLEEERRTCAACRRPGNEVHHKDGNWRNNDRRNLECRCRRCHNQATHGKSKPVRGCDADGNPIGSTHHWNRRKP